MTRLEEILIVLLQDNGLDKNYCTNILRTLRIEEQQADMIIYLRQNKNLTLNQIMSKVLEIFKNNN